MRLTATYRIQCNARDIDAKAQALAIEQSVEMPVGAIADPYVLDEIIGRVEQIEVLEGRLFEVRISLAAETIGSDPGQLLNMLFGNSSLHEDIALWDVNFPNSLLSAYAGPSLGMAGIRRSAHAPERALTCAAIKPQGLSAERLAELAYAFASGGIDIVKDDHGLADQGYSPFAERVRLCADAVRRANSGTGHRARYAPSLSGHLDKLRSQLRLARDEGIDTVLIAPMITGLAAFQKITAENRDMTFLAHPAFAGSSRIAPPLLIGRLFRMMGADAVIFPNYGGRFGYSQASCEAIARAALEPWGNFLPAIPVPAGGMSVDRLDEMISFYGTDVMPLIGGSLLAAGDRLTQETSGFVACVKQISENYCNGR